MAAEESKSQLDSKSLRQKFRLRFSIPMVCLAVLLLAGGAMAAAHFQMEWIGHGAVIFAGASLFYVLDEAYRRGWSDREQSE